MTTPVKSPLCDFRASNVPAAGVAATATTTAPVSPTGLNQTPILVVQDITTCLVSGTAAAQGPIQVSLIDGTAGSTNVQWTGLMAAPAGVAGFIIQQFLNIPCKSGFATLQFGTGLGTTGQTSVAFGGYYNGPNNN